ncbi:MAG: carbohydrate binding domain-containing protein [Kiritimatiellae bacterium]|nr:carbohydrate binding domain-containing protein [Kiritimatiellia bacterium]
MIGDYRPCLLLALLVFSTLLTIHAQMPTAEACRSNVEKLHLSQAASLIKNGGFEDGDGSPWTFRGKRPGEEPGGNVRRSPGIAHSGAYALRVDSAGLSPSVKYLTARQVASSEGRGRTIKVSFWSFLQTQPHANFDPVHLTVRQYRKSGLARHERLEVFNDTGEWTYGEKEMSVIDDLHRMDLLFTVRNTSADKPAVLFVDDVRCETIGVQPLEARLPAPELPVSDRWLPVCVTVAREILDTTTCRLDAFLTRPRSDTVLKRFSQTVAEAGGRWALDLAGTPPGPYEVRLFLSANGAGPVACVDLPFRVYEGPFE